MEITVTFCFNHPDKPATWLCARCGKGWCDDCVRMIKGACKNFAFCPQCRDFCEKVTGGKEPSPQSS